jgi:hypothetical protein
MNDAGPLGVRPRVARPDRRARLHRLRVAALRATEATRGNGARHQAPRAGEPRREALLVGSGSGSG